MVVATVAPPLPDGTVHAKVIPCGSNASSRLEASLSLSPKRFLLACTTFSWLFSHRSGCWMSFCFCLTSFHHFSINSLWLKDIPSHQSTILRHPRPCSVMSRVSTTRYIQSMLTNSHHVSISYSTKNKNRDCTFISAFFLQGRKGFFAFTRSDLPVYVTKSESPNNDLVWDFSLSHQPIFIWCIYPSPSYAYSSILDLYNIQNWTHPFLHPIFWNYHPW